MVKPKKHLGQHFLIDDGIAQKIADSLTNHLDYKTLVEIGPGTGALTKHLVNSDLKLHLIEIDHESIVYLNTHFPELINRTINADFLHEPLDQHLESPYGLIGNFPYNISSQIMFRVLTFKDHIPEVVGMFQKEVAERISSKPGSKKIGILSVLLQTWYHAEYLFTVDKEHFKPPPKVQSGVIRLTRNNRKSLPIEEKFFKQVVKMAFNQRRKTLRNALKSLLNPSIDQSLPVFAKRAEQLTVEDFISLAITLRSVR